MKPSIPVSISISIAITTDSPRFSHGPFILWEISRICARGETERIKKKKQWRERRRRRRTEKSEEERGKGNEKSGKREIVVDGLLTTNALMVAAVPWFEDWCSADVLKPPFIRASLGAPLDASTHHLWDATELLQISLPLSLSLSFSRSLPPLVIRSRTHLLKFVSVLSLKFIYSIWIGSVASTRNTHTHTRVSCSVDSMTHEREKWIIRHLISRGSQEFI